MRLWWESSPSSSIRIPVWRSTFTAANVQNAWCSSRLRSRLLPVSGYCASKIAVDQRPVRSGRRVARRGEFVPSTRGREPRRRRARRGTHVQRPRRRDRGRGRAMRSATAPMAARGDCGDCVVVIARREGLGDPILLPRAHQTTETLTCYKHLNMFARGLLKHFDALSV